MIQGQQVSGEAAEVRSEQVFNHQENNHAGHQHSPHHNELVLRRPLLNQAHHGVGQAQHVCYIQHLLVGALQ